mmetsp:Transcript_7503/g.15261  ORF Transcript_7503/g.15261 Transcript_7503/m.15261 type:complete len:215 (-) Transcript_7503:276-920(-)
MSCPTSVSMAMRSSTHSLAIARPRTRSWLSPCVRMKANSAWRRADIWSVARSEGKKPGSCSRLCGTPNSSAQLGDDRITTPPGETKHTPPLTSSTASSMLLMLRARLASQNVTRSSTANASPRPTMAPNLAASSHVPGKHATCTIAASTYAITSGVIRSWSRGKVECVMRFNAAHVPMNADPKGWWATKAISRRLASICSAPRSKNSVAIPSVL